MEELISHIVEDWFLVEPLLFSAYCTHQLAENTRMMVPMRTGQMRIEYNPDILKDWSRDAVEERLRFEVIRILLGHPYQRQPYGAKKSVLGIASDVTLSDLYRKIKSIIIPPGLQYDSGLSFEEYYAIVDAFFSQNLVSPPGNLEGQNNDGDDSPEDTIPAGDSSGSNDYQEGNEITRNKTGGCDGAGDKLHNSDDKPDENLLQRFAREASEAAELWEEDQLAAEQVKETIRRVQRSKQWGSLAGDLKDEIEATTLVRIDYRTILSGFRASILCSKRRLTRMIPSRRYGFQYMGSKRDFATRLLVAIDVSGSISDKQVSQALSIVNRFFKYGVECVDVIQFDAEIRGEVLSMKKARKTLKIEGRGGTSFQEPIDYFHKNRYDGLILITDGCAPTPTLPKSFYGNILWMLYDAMLYREKTLVLPEHQAWIAQLPKSKFTILPPI